MNSPVPIVSVVLAAHDAERYLRLAVESVLRQSLRELELVVVDDGSTDATADILASIDEPRLVVVRNSERQGLAASLNRGLDHVRGRYVARLDADDVALPDRLTRQLARLGGPIGVSGSGVLDLGPDGSFGRVHLMPVTPAAVRWHALFGAPFYHPTVLVDRELLERHALRYDVGYAESEDYDLWARLLRVAEGVNVPEPLVLYRVHATQATQRRRDVQRACQQQVALREIGAIAPELAAGDAERAWLVGSGEGVNGDVAEESVDAYLLLLDRFERAQPGAAVRPVRAVAARAVARAARRAEGTGRVRLLRRAAALDPLLPVDVMRARTRRWRARRAALPVARAALSAPAGASAPTATVAA